MCATQGQVEGRGNCRGGLWQCAGLGLGLTGMSLTGTDMQLFKQMSPVERRAERGCRLVVTLAELQAWVAQFTSLVVNITTLKLKALIELTGQMCKPYYIRC